MRFAGIPLILYFSAYCFAQKDCPYKPYELIGDQEKYALRKAMNDDLKPPSKRDETSIENGNSAKFNKRAGEIEMVEWHNVADTGDPFWNDPTHGATPSTNAIARSAFIDGVTLIARSCGLGAANVFSCRGNCGLSLSEVIKKNAVVTGVIVGVSSLAITVGGLIITIYNTKNPPTPKTPPPAASPTPGTGRKLLHTNFRVEIPKSRAPPDMFGMIQLKPGDKVPETWYDAEPQSGKRDFEGFDGYDIDVSSYMERSQDDEDFHLDSEADNIIYRRDDPHDDLGMFKTKQDLQGFMYQLWQTVFIPRANEKQEYDQTYHLFAPHDVGQFDLVKGGMATFRIWLSEGPDDDNLTKPPSDPAVWSNWNMPGTIPAITRPTGQVCFQDFLPPGAQEDNSGPSVSWWNAFSDACNNAKKVDDKSTPKDFSYSGKGNLVNGQPDPSVGAGWEGHYFADGCNKPVQCSDLVGKGGDGKTGDAFNHANTCRGLTPDKKYHGGIFYHVWDKDTGDELKRDEGNSTGTASGNVVMKRGVGDVKDWDELKRDVNPVPNQCGYWIIHPLGQ